jgi:hypothetical protein
MPTFLPSSEPEKSDHEANDTSSPGLVMQPAFNTGTTGLSARDVRGPSPLVVIENEPPHRLIVDSPLPEELARGVFIQYRTEHMRVVPVFGRGALDVSPRIGHVHVTVDDAPWHFIDASGETVVVIGLKPGPHQVLFELAGPSTRSSPEKL